MSDTIVRKTGACPRILGAASVLALSLGTSGHVAAQEAAAQEGDMIESISVTGSRIRTDGYSAPTPVMVLDEESMRSTAPITVSESLSLMPQFSTEGQPSTAVEYANLRNLGSERTLVLLDGRRHVPTFSSGVVDLATIPTSLIRSTEVVTGGASASWGSDAVAGVINLMLKDDLEGIESNVQYGENLEYGDDQSFSASIAAGTSFAGGRGHILIGAEHADSDGIEAFIHPYRSRPYGNRGMVSNQDYSEGQPQFIYAEDVRRADVHDGGLITSGPLRGTTFLGGGETGQFQYGEVYGNNMIGGGDNAFEPPDPGGDAKPPLERTSFLGRVSYDFTDSLGGFLEYNYSEAISRGRAILGRNQGSVAPNNGCEQTGYSGPRFGNINVSIDNAFLPESVRQDMVDADIDCFNFGRSFREEGMGLFHTEEGSPGINRFVAGLDGLLDNGWTWDAYVQYGEAEFRQRRGSNIHSVRFQAAVDAVVDPDSGAPVCRINIDDDPANDDPACVPFNMFGAGSPSREAREYVTGTGRLDQTIEQTVAAWNIQGDLFQGWAGPISAAAGLEYRKEEISATVDPDSEQNLWQTSNRKGIEGDYDVKEVYTEFAVPLLRGAPLAEAVDLNLALRGTDYSSSGGVTTWKVGATWEVNDQVRLRFTDSRDIRAGNLGELYTPTAVNIRNVVNPDTSVTVPVQAITSGNPTLDPEEADTFTAGIVVAPEFLEGLQFSLDYYAIDIQGMIGTLSPQEIVDQCYLEGMQEFCGRLTLDSEGVITGIDSSYANLDQFETSGVDLVASYFTPLPVGDLNLRLVSTYVEERKVTYLTDGSVDELAGTFGNPEWQTFIMANYQVGNFGVGIDWRWYDGTILNNDREEGCAGPGCANVNSVSSMSFTSLNLNYEVPSWGTDFFVRVDNVFDKEPPFPLRNAYNDNFGRGIRTGFRLAL